MRVRKRLHLPTPFPGEDWVKYQARLTDYLETAEFFDLPPKSLILYEGSQAPPGWKEDTGPSADPGYIWIRRDNV